MIIAYLKNLGPGLILGVIMFIAVGAGPATLDRQVITSDAAGNDTSTLHYKIYRKGKIIGDHHVSFVRDDSQAKIDIAFKIQVKFLGITAFQMDHEASELWALEPLALQSLSAVTQRSTGTFSVNVGAGQDGYKVDVNSEEQPAPAQFVPTSFTMASHLFADEPSDVVLLDTLSGIFRPSRIEFRKVFPNTEFENARGDVRYYEIIRLDTGVISHRIWYDDADAFLQVGLATKDGHYVEYRRQKTSA